MDTKNGKPANSMKWTTIIVASGLLGFSTIIRLFQGKEADKSLCWMFVVIAGLIYGANFINIFKNK